MKTKQKCCWNCKEIEKYDNFGFCRKYNVEIGLELAKKDRVCRDWEKEA